MKKTLFTQLCTLLFVAVCLTGGTSFAQTAAAYTYARTTGATFASISGSGTVTSLANNDDLVEGSVGIGFTFYFAGVAYTTVSISTNGWASLANYTADAAYDNTAAIPGAGFLMPYWDDLTGTNSGNNVYYTTTGSSPNRIFTIEWASWNTLNQPANARKANFQIKLYETSNIVQFCYGSFTTNTTTSTGSIGIANSASDYKSLATVSATTASSSTFTTTLATWVANGSVFTWTPPCSSAPTGGTANATATSGCVPTYASTLSLSGATTTNVAYQWQSSPTGSTWTNVSGATNSTYAATVSAAIQYRCALRCSYSASVGNSSARSLAAPGPTVTVSPTLTSICPGGSQSITASGATTYTWSPTTNLSASTGATVTCTPTASRVYTVTGTTSGCTNTAVVTVNLSGGAPGTISGTASACPGASSTLTNSVTGGTWSSSNSAVATVNPTSGVVTGIIGAGGSSATISYATGCGSPATQTFNVLSAPTLSVNLPVVSYCYGHAVPLIASGSGSGYTWAPATGLSATTGATVMATPGSTTTYTVTTTGGSCNTTATSVVTRGSATDSFVLSPLASPATTCSGGSSSLTPRPSGFAYNSVSSISYSLITQTSPVTITFTSSTDEDTATVALPFTFNYYGVPYSSINIGTNGYITFTGQDPSYSNEALPSATAPLNMVALFWSDLDIAATTPAGSVTTSVEGTSPNRKFVIYYKSVYDYLGSVAGYSGQIVLYETSNTIDLIVTSTTSGSHVCGLQDATGALAITAPGRNNASYTISTPEAWRFSSTPTVTYQWSPATFLSSTTSAAPTASGVTSSTTYSVIAVNSANNCVSTGSVAVNIGTLPGTISASATLCTGSSANVVFTGPGSGTGTYTVNGGSAIGFSFDATGSYVLSVSPTSTTTYELTSVVTGSCSRSITGQVSVITVVGTVPVLTANPACTGSTLALNATASAGTYSWAGPGGFTSTLQNPTIASVTTAAVGVYTFSTTSTAGSCNYSAQVFAVVAQAPTVTVTASPASICAGGSSSLSDSVIAPTAFNVSSIPYTSYTTTGTAGPAADNARPLVTLPFTFTLYGTAYTQVRIHANGFISFGTNPGVATSPIAIPSASAPQAMIALFWTDLNPAAGGTVNYTTIGTTPNRKFIVSYNDVPNVWGDLFTGQIILYETSNIIDLMLKKANFNEFDYVVTGVQNTAGTSALAPPGRNGAYYSITGSLGEGWRFSTPSYTYSWSPATALSSTTIANPVSSGLTSTQTYTVTTADINSSCTGVTATKTINVNPMPTLYSVTGGGNYCGVTPLNIGLSNSDAAVSYQLKLGATNVGSPITGSTGATSFGTFTTAGTYIVQATGTGGCVDTMTGSAVITNSAVAITLGANPSVCQPISSTTLSYSSPTGSPTTYDITWDAAALTAGFSNVTAGSLGGTITLTIPGGSAGTFTGTLTVSNAFCTSSTYSFSVTVYAYPTGSITSANAPCSGYSTNIVFTGTAGATVAYKVDGGSISTATLTGGTYSLSTGALTASHNYTLYDVHNPVCTTVLDTTAYINPVAMQWAGGTSSVETDWNTGTNWTCGFVPGASDNVTIPSGTTYAPAILTSATGTTGALTVASGVSVTLNNGSTLNVKGNLVNGGTFTGSGLLTMNGTSAQTIGGIGTVNNFDLNNSTGATITPASKLTIKKELSVTSGTLVTNDSLVLYSDTASTARVAQLPPSGSVISGNVKVMQYVIGGLRRYRFWSHPFSNYIGLSQVQNFIDVTGTGGASNGFTTTASNAPSAFRYNPNVGNSSLASDPGWRPFTNAGTVADSNRLHRHQGIRLFFRGAKDEGLYYASGYIPSPVTVAQWGSLNQGNQTIVLSKGTGANQDYNMIGNPYASAVDIGTIVTNAKISGNIVGGAFYIWNPMLGTGGMFQVVTINTATPVPYYIQANCAFQVRAAHNNDTLNFAESNKVVTPTVSLIKTLPGYTSLSIYDESYHPWDMLYLQFNQGASDEDDNNTDARKLSSSDFGFYSLSSDNKKLALDVREFAAGKTIPLGIQSDYTKAFIIKADNIAVPSGNNLYLHDKLLKQYILLQQGTEYRFAITADKTTQGDNRFELKMSPALLETKVKGLEMSLFPNPAAQDVDISFTSGEEGNVKLRILDLSGVSVYNQDLGHKAIGNVNVPLSRMAAGIYMVELTSGSQKVVQRLIKE